ncbi:MAG TPA: hypothetical protein VNA14_09965 [Mycobacteriales bacterium]|nr:hypothetical protein [Mycobacteriales bacterium]
MKRSLMLGVTAALTGAVVAMPASAAPPKPMSETYTANGLPDPTPIAGTTCVPTLPTSRHSKVVTIPAAGTLELRMANATPALDWSVAILDSKGRMLGCTDGGTPETVEVVKVKIKTAGKYTLASNNFAGTPTCTMKWTYTPAK